MEHEVLFIKKNLSWLLPSTLFEVCDKFLDTYPDISEIRLRREQRVTFTLRERNIESGYICDDLMMNTCLSLWISTERYKQIDGLVNGVISLPNGFRVGVVGTALIDKGTLTNIYNISALNIRLPRFFNGVSLPLYKYITSLPYHHRSVLLISAPCNGKTTVLRDLAYTLSTPPVSERVCVVDPRQELSPPNKHPASNMDVFSGYPTPLGIEIATRYFNPRYIICDEITNKDELESLKNAAHSGVPLIASAHASSLSEAAQKPVLRTLLKEKVLYSVAELKLNENGISFLISDRNEVENALCHRNLLLH